MRRVLARVPLNWYESVSSVLALTAIVAGFVCLWQIVLVFDVDGAMAKFTHFVAAAALAAFIVVCIRAAVVLHLTPARLKRYTPILKGVETMKIQHIADITNTTKSLVLSDLRAMIQHGILTDVYIDYRNELVVNKIYIPDRSHKTVVTCSGCGANNELIVGIPRRCDFCKQPLVLGAL